MIALAWSRQLDQGNARVVLRTVMEAEVPVILVPIPHPYGTFDPAFPSGNAMG